MATTAQFRAAYAEHRATEGRAPGAVTDLLALWYERRPLVARLRGRRTPSRFDVWEGLLP